MVEKFRLYSGATELNYSAATATETNDHVVNSASATIEASTNVIPGSIIDFKKVDGSTLVFSAKVDEINKGMMWDLKLLTDGYELMNIPVHQVYENVSPEYIVQDVIDNYTENLTYVPGTASGVTISKYIANAYAIDVIKDMIDILRWHTNMDANGNYTFGPKGDINNGIVLTNGSNFDLSMWKEDKTQMFNHVKIIGGFENHFHQQVETGSSATWTLDHKPSGTFKATVGGNEISPDDYTVDAENKTVTFTSSKTDPTFDYAYDRPIIVENQDDNSINTYGEIYKEIQAPWLDNSSDARRYSQNLLEIFSTPIIKAKGKYPELNFDISCGETVRVVDAPRNRDEELVVVKLTRLGEEGKTEYELGDRDLAFFDWQREVQERIKKLERRFLNEEDIVFTKLTKSTASVSLSVDQKHEYNYPRNTFILGNLTLNRLRSEVNGHVLNFEADCSDNSNDGTWYGSDIDGDQFLYEGWRLSCGQFNGSDNYISASDSATLDLSGDFSIAIAVKVSSLPGAETYILNKWDGTDGYAIRIASDNKVELIYSDSSSDSTIKASTALTAEVWQHIIFVKSGTDLTVYVNGTSDNTETGGATVGTNSNALEVGRYSTNYFTGFLDEVMIFDDNLSTDEVSDIYNKNVDDAMTDCVCYLSMDNPILNIRLDTRFEVGESTDRTTHKALIEFKNTTFKHSSTTAYWDTSTYKYKLRMSTENDHTKHYATMAQTEILKYYPNKVEAVTLESNETKFGGDIIKYYVNLDNNDAHWEEVQLGTELTLAYPGQKLRVKILMIGNGGYDTYTDEVKIATTQIS